MDNWCGNDLGHIFMVSMTTIAHIITMVFTFLAHYGNVAVFKNSTDEVAMENYVEMTPSRGGTLALWIVLFLWQLAWLIYGLSTFARKGIDDWLSVSPPIIPLVLYFLFIVSSVLHIGWLFLWDREMIIAAFVFTLLLATTLIICLILSIWSLHVHLGVLAKKYLVDIWIARAILQNGLAFYATWAVFLMFSNMATTMAYAGSVKHQVATSIVLAILTVAIAVWFFVEIFLLDRFVRYLITPYIVLIWVFSGIISRTYTGSRNSVFMAVILAFTLAATVAKLVLTWWRHRRLPLHQKPVTEENVQAGYDVKVEPQQRTYKIGEYFYGDTPDI